MKVASGPFFFVDDLEVVGDATQGGRELIVMLQ